ncbi:hypothetical protein AAC387_Pa02g1572 [Persea americana]
MGSSPNRKPGHGDGLPDDAGFSFSKSQPGNILTPKFGVSLYSTPQAHSSLHRIRFGFASSHFSALNLRKDMRGYKTSNFHFDIATTTCLRSRWYRKEGLASWNVVCFYHGGVVSDTTLILCTLRRTSV